MMCLTWVTPGKLINCSVGSTRTYLSQDIIIRILREYFGYNVIFVMNITDIDDKIIKRYISYFLHNYAHRSNERNIPFDELARKYEMEFWDDMATLGCHKPDVITRVSEVYWFCCFLYKVVYSRDYRDD